MRAHQECFNSPYGHTHFPNYAEEIGFTPGKPYDTTKSPSETVKMLSSAAKQVNSWVIGGMYVTPNRISFDTALGSIPERDADKIYNTCTVYNPQGD